MVIAIIVLHPKRDHFSCGTKIPFIKSRRFVDMKMMIIYDQFHQKMNGIKIGRKPFYGPQTGTCFFFLC